MILTPFVKESSIFTHKFNFDAREDASGAMTISTHKLELHFLNSSYKINSLSKISGH
jgi:hypothetical protein